VSIALKIGGGRKAAVIAINTSFLTAKVACIKSARHITWRSAPNKTIDYDLYDRPVLLQTRPSSGED